MMIRRLFSRWREKPEPAGYLERAVVEALDEFADRHRRAFDIFEMARINAEAIEYLREAAPSPRKYEQYLAIYNKSAGKHAERFMSSN